MTVLDIISQAMRAIVALGSGDVPSAEEAEDGRLFLNSLLESWNTELLSVFTIRKDVYALTIAQQDYLIGTGAALNSPRPVAIQSANFLHTATGLSYALKLLSDEEWAAVLEKNTSAIIPTQLYDDFANPISTLSIHPKPSQAGSLELWTWQQLTAFAAVTDTVAFPPGYDLALIFNLARVIAPGLVGKVDPRIEAQAAQYKAAIQKQNLPPRPGVAQEAMAKQQAAAPVAP